MWRFLEDPMWTWLFSKQIWERISTQCPLYHKCRGPPKSAPPLPAVVTKDWAHTSVRGMPAEGVHSSMPIPSLHLCFLRYRIKDTKCDYWSYSAMGSLKWHQHALEMILGICDTGDNWLHSTLSGPLWQNKTRQNRTDLLQAEANG